MILELCVGEDAPKEKSKIPDNPNSLNPNFVDNFLFIFLFIYNFSLFLWFLTFFFYFSCFVIVSFVLAHFS